MGHSLELAGRQESVRWTNEATGVSYRVTPTRNFQDGKQHCREFSTELSTGKGAKKDTVRGVACRGPKGEWTIRA
jgi:surface antigen